jgi:hypothetical protein
MHKLQTQDTNTRYLSGGCPALLKGQGGGPGGSAKADGQIRMRTFNVYKLIYRGLEHIRLTVSRKMVTPNTISNDLKV